MPERLSLRAAAEFVSGMNYMPDGPLLDILANNNTELKVLLQGRLKENEPVLITDARTGLLEPYICSDLPDLPPVTSGHVIRVFRTMDPAFVEVVGTRGNLHALQTTAGRNAAGTGGQLANLAKDTKVPLRGVIGESLKPRKMPGNVTSMGSIETRLSILTTLWKHASSDWIAATDLLDATGENGIEARVTRSHITKLRAVGIVERQKPGSGLVGEGGSSGYLYRIKQENGDIPPTEVVERYLAIVLLTSVMDPTFINDGLDYLREISQSSTHVPNLIKRSFDHTRHSGKNSR